MFSILYVDDHQCDNSPLVLARMCGKWCYYGTFVLVPVVQVGSNLVVFGKRSLKDFRKRFFLENLSYVSFERMKKIIIPKIRFSQTRFLRTTYVIVLPIFRGSDPKASNASSRRTSSVVSTSE